MICTRKPFEIRLDHCQIDNEDKNVNRNIIRDSGDARPRVFTHAKKRDAKYSYIYLYVNKIF